MELCSVDYLSCRGSIKSKGLNRLAGSGSSGLLSGLRRSLEWFLGVRVSLGVVLVLCVVCGVVIWALTDYSYKVAIGEVGVIGFGVGVYWDRNCYNPVHFISWGKIVISPLGPVSRNVTVYVRNEGRNPVVVQLSVSSWSPPSVERHMWVSWDYDGRVLQSGEKAEVTLTVLVDPGIGLESPRIREFRFDITVSATYPARLVTPKAS